ncbi:MAG: PIN domain-containing protein, partial [Kiloniellales bacterium]|nr:PIN domain-containing protein [Kiloniellales bacterium]
GSPPAGGFLDTNILVYAFTADRRAPIAQALLEQGGVISVQGLNEFTNVARRKLGMSWAEVKDALAAIRTLCRTIRPLDLETHLEALKIAERYGSSIFDALIIAAALRAQCRVLFSEDLQDGLVIDRRLRIVDPFRERSR